MQTDWDEPTEADLREAPDEDNYQRDVEETQDHFVLDERRECLRRKGL
jgi:hypothetical protein